MDKARYLNVDGVYTEIYADRLNLKEYEKIYKGNLYCEEEGCNAEMILYNRQIGTKIRIFKTKSGSIHKPGCKNEIMHKGTKGKVINLIGEDVNISQEHIDRVLKESYRDYYNSLYNNNEPNAEKLTKKKKKKVSPKTDEDEVITYNQKANPTTNGEGIVIEGKKEPPIYKREVSEISEKDKNSYKEVHGIVKSIIINQDEVIIDIIGIDNSKISIYIGQPYRNQYPQDFRLLSNYNTYFSNQKEKNMPVICTCIGELMEINNSYVVQIYGNRDIRIDNLSLYQITNLLYNNIQ